MQSLYKILKSPVTSGNEIISLPDIKLMNKKKLEENSLAIQDNNTEAYDEVYDKILSEANSKAEIIIKTTEETAKKLLDDAKQSADKALIDAKDEGYQQGYRQGYNEGYDFGINEANVEADKIRKAADIYMESCKSETETYIKNKHKEIIELSLEIAKQVIHSEVMINPEVVNKIAAVVLAKVTDRNHVILKVNPVDFNVVRGKKDDLAIYVENPNNLFIIADSTVTQGSVKAETSSGFIDGDIEAQLDILTKILLRD